jgi:hypothetical protein
MTLLDDRQGQGTDLGAAALEASRLGRSIPNLAASATSDCDDVSPTLTAEVISSPQSRETISRATVRLGPADGASATTSPGRLLSN